MHLLHEGRWSAEIWNHMIMPAIASGKIQTCVVDPVEFCANGCVFSGILKEDNQLYAVKAWIKEQTVKRKNCFISPPYVDVVCF